LSSSVFQLIVLIYVIVLNIKIKIVKLVKFYVALVHRQTILTERPPLVGEDTANFVDRGCHVVSVYEK
jgi:hypothetical protein